MQTKACMPTYIDALTEIKIWHQEHGLESKWKRTNTGKITDRFFTVFTVHTSGGHSFVTILRQDIQLVWSMMKKHNANPAGELVLKYILGSCKDGQVYEQSAWYTHQKRAWVPFWSWPEGWRARKRGWFWGFSPPKLALWPHGGYEL